MAALTLGTRLKHMIGDTFGAAIVEQTLEKAIKEVQDGAGEPKTQFFDPMTLFMGREWIWKRPEYLSFYDLRQMARNPIIGSIIQTRISQVASFCSPRLDAYEVGFTLQSTDPNAKEDTKAKEELTRWLFTSGIPGYGEDLLETLARKVIRDSLELDQACAEIVNRRNGMPAYMVGVDGATIRKLKASLDFATPQNQTEPIYVQVIHDQIETEYTPDQLIFGVRNPRTDIRVSGYGMSELEMLVRTVTTILNTDRYNAGQMTQGGTSKGLLAVKGGVSDTEWAIFKRDFREAIRNAGSYWRPPMLRVAKDADIDWVQMDRSNRDMEYAALFDFLVKQACGVYQIAPEEINWSIGAAGTRTTFESKGDEKLKASTRKGLKPLLTFFANQINTHVISRIDERFWMVFEGVDDTREKDVEIREKETKTYKLINETREDLGLDPIPGGDVILNKDWMMAQAEGQPTPAENEDRRTKQATDADDVNDPLVDVED